MITPQFSVRQDENNIYVSIKAPYIKASDVEFVVDGEVFIFSLHPYYLRLRFSSKLKQDGDDDEPEELKSHASYDVGTSMINVRIPKETPGEEFKDLDMITKLLARKGDEESQSQNPKPLIQELDQGVNDQAVQQAEQFDWEIEQRLPDDDVTQIQGAKYGFDDQYSGQLGVSIQSGNDLNELVDPEHDSVNSRITQRIANESAKFDAEHYWADFMETDYIQEFIKYKPQNLTLSSLEQPHRDKMAKLPRKSYDLVKSPKSIYINLVGILFAYCYDNRTTMGDPTVESVWTIGKLSPLVCCLDSHFTTLRPLMVSCTRRALSFPLYRNWELVQQVWKDVYAVLRAASDDLVVLVRILVELVTLFDTTDHCFYIYNRIWFEDYASWAQQANTTVIRSLAHELHKISLDKNEIGLELVGLEQAAMEVANQEPDSDDDDDN